MISLTKIPSLVGEEKKYKSPHTSRQMLIMGVKTNVKFENNGLSLDVSPKRKAITDFVPYEDIDDVIAQRHLYGFGIFVIIWAIAFAALSSGLTLLLGLFFLWFYWGGKAIIKRKSDHQKKKF